MMDIHKLLSRPPIAGKGNTRTFSYFSCLPPELRDIIWNIALREEGRSRIVLLHRRCIVPFAHLNSPFLSVDRQSRRNAQKFYHVKLAACNISRCSSNSSGGGGGGGGGVSSDGSEDFDLFSVLSWDGLDEDHDMAEVVDRLLMGQARTNMGAVYVSPEFDTFLLAPLLSRGSDRKMVMSEDLPLSACAQVRNLIRLMNNRLHITTFSRQEAASIWQLEVFTSLRAFKAFGIISSKSPLKDVEDLSEYSWKTGDTSWTDLALEWAWKPASPTADSKERVLESVTGWGSVGHLFVAIGEIRKKMSSLGLTYI
ncbi:hypothetical protein M426DRAFT_326193 [Hypoxylon sp. CI-4A]|nr:hypothetical protein M426DRAFT_326193 [Hypoxylon sp. CI-4A]